MIRFDGYTATSAVLSADRAKEMLFASMFAGDEFRAGSGYHTFESRLSLVDRAGDQVASVLWGGDRVGGRIMFEVKGERSPEFVDVIRREDPSHRCTRADACADFDQAGAFDRIVAAMEGAKEKHRLWGERRGDWQDHPELGRTFYLGAPTSAVRVRGYEKGKQPEYRHLGRFDWARVEVQARPQKDAREEFARLSAADVWGASKWTRELAGDLLLGHVDPHPCGTVYRVSQRDAALRHMVRQYGAHLAGLADDLGGWAELGLTLRELLDETRNEGRPVH